MSEFQNQMRVHAVNEVGIVCCTKRNTMIRHRYLLVTVFLLIGALAKEGYTKELKVGVVQTVIENTLSKNLDKHLKFIEQAKSKGCRLVIFPECALYWSEVAVDTPTKADFDAAIAQIGRKANSQSIYVIFCTQYRSVATQRYSIVCFVYSPKGKRLMSYSKNMEVPQRFHVEGIPCNIAICSDRGYLEHSDLPCLVQGSQIIIDTSGGHGGDDGRPDLRWIRYRPWAMRNNAFVIVCNPVHDDTDFMGNSPWGGGSAIIRPDGSIQASRTHEKDVLIIEQIDTAQATRIEAQKRRNHPIFKSFWDMGKKLLAGQSPAMLGSKKPAVGGAPIPDIAPYLSAERNVKIAAAQIACSGNMHENVSKIEDYIRQAANHAADIVVFPELAVTGHIKDDVLAASQSALDDTLRQIRNAARSSNIYVIVGMPSFVDGHRSNCAFVIGNDGSIKTRYAQIVITRSGLFKAGLSTKAMWFRLKGVPAIVTIGDDSKWVEIGDLAANRGMYLHFHISYEADSSAEETILRKQKNLLMLMYAKYGALVNAADASQLQNPSSPAGGTSMIVSREGGHNKPAPSGLEYYLPYQTSIVKSAGLGETMLLATRKTLARNDMDLNNSWRNRNRKNRAESGWYEWIKKGVWLIENETGESTLIQTEQKQLTE